MDGMSMLFNMENISRRFVFWTLLDTEHDQSDW